MNTKTVEIAIIEPYLDFFIKDKDLLREIYPNGINRELRIEFILVKKLYT
ncbi:MULTISPECIES: hypothetical protein [spotted fever group]|uniref:Uncharacterized protein n=2 Tax=Rickettsia slovaca TaxID=35794 RepID=H8LN22_RICSL|nr:MULTISPECIES: hypothetical protein [spotted fever group]AEV91708.1 hypothetical protein Rsl_13 [Rickettsia slovaca 13-B]AFD19023.1 hypothetical protein MC3_00070 [Rickettsia slovaca str. D-CWPP]